MTEPRRPPDKIRAVFLYQSQQLYIKPSPKAGFQHFDVIFRSFFFNLKRQKISALCYKQ
jgi:hypothetical protein